MGKDHQRTRGNEMRLTALQLKRFNTMHNSDSELEMPYDAKTFQGTHELHSKSDYECLIEEIENVKLFCESDIENELLWREYFPKFMACFQKWIESNPPKEKIKGVSQEFSGIMQSVLNDYSQSMKKYHWLLQFKRKVVGEMLDNKNCFGKKSQELIDAFVSIPEFNEANLLKRIDSIGKIKDKMKKTFRDFIEKRNHCLNIEQLFFIISNSPPEINIGNKI